MFQNGFIIPQIGFKFDSIKRKNGFNNASCLPQQCLKIGVKPGDSRNETGQQPERNRAAPGMGDRSSSEKLGSELARSSSEFLGATRSSSDGHYTITTQSRHYTVTTWSLRGHYALFSSKARSVPRQPSRANQSFLQKKHGRGKG